VVEQNLVISDESMGKKNWSASISENDIMRVSFSGSLEVTEGYRMVELPDILLVEITLNEQIIYFETLQPSYDRYWCNGEHCDPWMNKSTTIEIQLDDE